MTIFNEISCIGIVTIGKVHPEIFSMQFKRVKYLGNPLSRLPQTLNSKLFLDNGNILVLKPLINSRFGCKSRLK